MGLPVGDPHQVIGYLSSLKRGGDVTYAGFKSGVPSLSAATKSELQKLFEYLVSGKTVNRDRNGRATFTGDISCLMDKPASGQPTVTNYPTMPAETRHALASRPHETSSARDRSISVKPRDPLYEKAYKFFDPNQNIFRGAVEKYDGNDYGAVRVQVRVHTPTGIRHGIVSVHRREKKMHEIAEGMRDGLVLVRKLPGSPDLIDKPMEFEPLINIRSEDNATLNGERIATTFDFDENRILYLPIVGRSVKLGVADGVGYLEAGTDTWGHLSLQPVFVEGAGMMVWNILPEVPARRISKERETLYWTKDARVFYIGEVPMTAAEKTRTGLKRIDYCLSSKRGNLSAFDFDRASGEDSNYAIGGIESIPDIVKLLVRTFGLSKYATEAGLKPEVFARVDEIKGIISKIAAMKGLSKREQAIIYSMYERGSPEYEKFMEWWLGEGVDLYVNQLEQEGRFSYPWTADESPSDVKKERKKLELSAGVPFREAGYCGFFDEYTVKNLARYEELPSYLAAVDAALGITGSRILNSHLLKGRFSMDDVKKGAVGLVDETLFWDVVSRSFKGVDVQQTWDKLLQGHRHIFAPHQMSLWKRIAQPYVELVRKKAS